MNAVPSVPIGGSKTNNKTTVQLYFNVGTVSQTVRSGNGPYIHRNWSYDFRTFAGRKNYFLFFPVMIK